MDNIDSEFASEPPELGDIAKKVTLNLLPQKSKEKYGKLYELFKSVMQCKID